MFKNKKVLLVDDEEDILTMLQSRLTTEGYSVLTARDGVEGLSVAKTWKPDLIILDILMPKMDGTEMSGVLKENPETQNIPILFLTVLHTGKEGPPQDTESSNVVLGKPFSAKELLNKVDELLQRGSR